MTIYLLIAAIDFVVGVLALSKKGNKATLALSLFCFCTCVWSIELFLLTYLQDAHALDFWFHLTRLGMFLIPPALALLVMKLVRAQTGFFRRYVVFPGFVIALSQFVLNNTFFPSTLRPAVGGHLPTVDWIYYSFIFNFLFCFIASMVFSAMAFRTAAHRDRQRIRWLLIIVIVTFFSGASSIYLLSHDFYLSKFVGATTNAIFMLLLFYATVNHHLVDIRLAVTIAVSRMVLLVSLAGIYMLLSLSMPGLPNDTGALLVVSVLILVGLELYPTILKWLEPNTQRLLRSGDYDCNEVMFEAGAELKRCTSYTSVAALLDYVFYRVIKVRGYRVYLIEPGADAQHVRAVSLGGAQAAFDIEYESLSLDPHLLRSSVIMVDEIPPDLVRQLAVQSAMCFLPLRRDGQLQAIVLVDSSSVYSYYRYDDIRLMEWLVGELSQALHRVATHERLDGELAEAKKKLSMMGVMNLYHHDIKAPLSIIDGIVSNDLYDNDKRRSVILEQVAWGSRLIATMAQLLKADRKRTSGPVNLQDVLDDCCFVFKRSVKHLNVEHAGSYTVEADADDLKILFINVIKNAVEAFHADRTLELQVRTWASSYNAYVSISDNGVGMSAEQLDSLWLDVGSTKQGGNGIGLLAIKKIADEHGADITVTSTQGNGSTFTFAFPLRDGDLNVLIEPQNSLV